MVELCFEHGIVALRGRTRSDKAKALKDLAVQVVAADFDEIECIKKAVTAALLYHFVGRLFSRE